MPPAARFASQDGKFSSLSATARKKLAPSMSGVSGGAIAMQWGENNGIAGYWARETPHAPSNEVNWPRVPGCDALDIGVSQ